MSATMAKVRQKRLELESEARVRAEKLDHTLSDFATGYGTNKTFAEAYCTKCYFAVGVDAAPKAKFGIFGTAQAFRCPSKPAKESEEL